MGWWRSNRHPERYAAKDLGTERTSASRDPSRRTAQDDGLLNLLLLRLRSSARLHILRGQFHRPVVRPPPRLLRIDPHILIRRLQRRANAGLELLRREVILLEIRRVPCLVPP